jgi:hypothetical protein
MTKKVTDEERQRKEYAARGTRTQKHLSFRIDFDNLEKVNRQPNKGRYINDAIRAYEK